jgi:hypothetical protein
MRLLFKPSTNLGNWSVGLFGVSTVFFILFFVLVASGQRGGETFFSNLALTVPMLIAAILAVSSFFTGIIGIFRNGERAIIVFISTTLGFLVLTYGLAEILFPH